MAKRPGVLILFLMLAVCAAAAQASRAPLTNADVIRMAKAGIRPHTIVLRIRKGPDNFDTSAQALIRLKRARVSAVVMDAMLEAGRPPAPPAPKPLTAEALLEKTLDAIGPRDQLSKIHSIEWKETIVETVNDETATYAVQRLESYPDRLSLSVRRGAGAQDKLVISPGLNYETHQGFTRMLGAASAEPYARQISFTPAFVARHSGDYALTLLEPEDDTAGTMRVLKIGMGGTEYQWSIDSQTGRLLAIQFQLSSGEVITREFSDFRPVGDLALPFKWRTTEPGRILETTVSEYEVNPADDKVPFERPYNLSDTFLSLRVLDSQSVSHGQELGGNTSTGCQLSQAANTSVVNPLDDVNFAEDTTPSNLQMTCNSWDTTKFWPRKLNAMLVEASDGKAYILTCDQGPRGSQCAPLHAGQVFHGRRTDTGIAILGVNEKGKDQEVNYSIAQAETLP